MNRDDYLRDLTAALRRRGIGDSRIVEEARAHLVDAAEQGLRDGLTPEAADAQAVQRFGPVETVVRHYEAARPRIASWALVVAVALCVVGWVWLPRDASKLDVLGTQHVLVFLATGILLNLTPGQDTMYILARSIAHGRRAGVLSVLGITCGTIVHTVAAALGLSAILATSAQAFMAVRLAGAVYLVYLGLRLLFRTATTLEQPAECSDDAWSVFRSGVLTNLLNPKVALFFLAFLPQFIAPSTNSRTPAFLFLGAVFMTTGTVWCFVLAWFGAALSARVRVDSVWRSHFERATGALFLGLGVKLAVDR
jgi:threonine/homoserine/homoserine lactone efflux protein